MTIWETIYNFYPFLFDLVFLNRLILDAKADPLVCVDLVFWRELNKCLFLSLSLKYLFLK